MGRGRMRGDLRVNGARGRLSAASGKRKLSSIKAFFRFLVKEKVIEVTPPRILADRNCRNDYRFS